MADERHIGFGAKCDRLIRARLHPDFGALVPPLFPVAPLIGDAEIADGGTGRYAAALRRARPDLIAEVVAACGEAPWIVRSSGEEDGVDQANAGGYESLICREAHALFDCVAQVALSGREERARMQMELTGGPVSAGAIPCFVQPLLDIAVASAVEPEQAPYLDDEAVDFLDTVARRLIGLFDMAAIDCEWGIDTDAGFVSGTSIVARDRTAMTSQHAFGFGFAAAQTGVGRPIASVLAPAGSSLRLRRGQQLRRVHPRRFHLLQARPAVAEPALRALSVLSPETRATLDATRERLSAALILMGERGRGPFLVAPTLAAAWRSYLAMDAARRAALAMVLVGEGSAAEHAGIMFRQQGVTCLSADIDRVPAAEAAIFDRDRCYFGPLDAIAQVLTTERALMPLPADCFFSFVEPGADETRLMGGIAALPLDEEVRAAIVARSLWPAPDCWLADGDRVGSPSLAGVRLAGGKDAPGARTDPEPAFLARYRRAVEAARQGARSGDELAGPDLRLGVAALSHRAASGESEVADPGGAIALAAAHAAAGDTRAARLVLDCFAAVAAGLDRLPIYEQDERRALIEALGAAFRAGATPDDAAAVEALQLPVPAAIHLLAAIAVDPTLRDAARDFRRAHAGFLRAPAPAAPAAARALNDAARRFTDRLEPAPLADIAGLVRGTLIESYDATLKAMLVDLVGGGDRPVAGPGHGHGPYVDVMRQWIDWARTGRISAMESAVLDQFDTWLAQAREAPAPDDYLIEDRNWRVEFPQVADGEVDEYENPHVLHNLLHQWMLAGNVIGTSLLPRRLLRLHHFCTTFSMRATKVLRFTADLFELEIPMGTHKVSFAFTPQAISVEWSEPPDCPEDEIARLFAFELLLEKLRVWRFPALTFRREQLVGTWTLFIRIGRPPARGWTFDDFHDVVVALRFLFDSTYDFSYVEDDAVEGFAESLERPEWKSIFSRLIDYRGLFDDSAQYVFLHTVPLSSTVATLAQNPVARGLVRRCDRLGFRATMALIDALARWLDASDEVERWAKRYELLRQACLFAAASWPEDVVSRLARREAGHAGDELLAACVARRTDMAAAIRALVSPGGDATAWFAALILRRAPDLLLTPDTAPRLAAAIASTPATGQRCKQLLLARWTAALDEATLAALAGDLDTVPVAEDPGEERRVRAALPQDGPRLRFDVTRGIDWTALDAWYKSVA